MSHFSGRNVEIERIFNSFNSSKATLNVIRGRRRIGKSRLIKELSNQKKKINLVYLTSTPPVDGMSDEEERKLYSEQVKLELGLSYLPPHQSWVELFEFIASQCIKKNTILAIDEVNWLATKQPSFMSSFFLLWERTFSHKNNFMVILSGSLSSWIEQNIIMNKGFVGRISLDIILKELTLDDLPKFFGDSIHKCSHFDLMKMISAVGTVPRYLEELNLTKTAETNLKTIAFTKGGFLYDEFELMFYDLFSKKNKLYRNILETIGLSKSLLTPKDVINKLGKTYAGRDSEAFNVLEESGFIKKQYLWNLKTQSPSPKSYVLRLTDNYTVFYFRAIVKVKLKEMNTGLALLPNNISSLLGLQFENVTLNNLAFILHKLHISESEVVFAGGYTQSATKIRKGCQVDLLIQTTRRIYVCECKLYSDEIGKSIVSEVKQKLERIVQVRGCTYHPVLIHANSVADTVVDTEFFDEIIDMTSAFD